MHEVVNVELGANILAANKRLAEENRRLFDAHGVRAVDVSGSIGSGKTLLIIRLAELLKEHGLQSGVVVGDVAGKDDFERFRDAGLEAVNINTGKECHLDAHMVDHSLEHIDLDSIDVLFIENVGNMVCPADFPLGAHKRMVVVSVTEGDDSIRKHPIIIGTSDVVVINKVDLADVMEVDVGIMLRDVEKLGMKGRTVLTDAKHGRGISDLARMLELLP